MFLVKVDQRLEKRLTSCMGACACEESKISICSFDMEVVHRGERQDQDARWGE
jgi:hypothetical protein